MDFINYLTEQVLYLVPALIFLGWCLKQIPGIPNWSIPFVLILCGCIAANAILGWSIESSIQGILCAGAAVLGNQAVKQITNALEEQSQG